MPKRQSWNAGKHVPAELPHLMLMMMTILTILKPAHSEWVAKNQVDINIAQIFILECLKPIRMGSFPVQ